jgi:hypothetical protein
VAPRDHHPAGTRIDVDLNTFGLKLGDGLYGPGRRPRDHIDARCRRTLAIANDVAEQVSVFDNGRLVRTMPTSMGRGGTDVVAGKTFSRRDPAGRRPVVLDKGEVVTMNSATYGLPQNSAFGYNRKIGLGHADQHGRHLPPRTQRHGLGPRATPTPPTAA